MSRLLCNSQSPHVKRRALWQQSDKTGKGRGGKCQVKADASAVFGKSHQIPTRDILVIKTNKKRTDVCINQNMAEHQWWAALWRFSPRSEYTCGGQRGGDYLSSMLELLYLKSAWAHRFCSPLKGCGWISGSGDLFPCRLLADQHQCCTSSNY